MGDLADVPLEELSGRKSSIRWSDEVDDPNASKPSLYQNDQQAASNPSLYQNGEGAPSTQSLNTYQDAPRSAKDEKKRQEDLKKEAKRQEELRKKELKRREEEEKKAQKQRADDEKKAQKQREQEQKKRDQEEKEAAKRQKEEDDKQRKEEEKRRKEQERADRKSARASSSKDRKKSAKSKEREKREEPQKTDNQEPNDDGLLTKRIWLYRNGDAKFRPQRYAFNVAQNTNFERFYERVGKIAPPKESGRVLHVYTLDGVEVFNVDELVNDGSYVAAGNQGFQNVRDGYPPPRDNERPRTEQRARSEPIYTRPDQTAPSNMKLFVFLNGKGEKCHQFQFNQQQRERGMPWMIEDISKRFFVHGQRLCNMDGKTVEHRSQLIHKGAYVLVPFPENFRESWYYLPTDSIDTGSGEQQERKPRPKSRITRPQSQRKKSSRPRAVKTNEEDVPERSESVPRAYSARGGGRIYSSRARPRLLNGEEVQPTAENDQQWPPTSDPYPPLDDPPPPDESQPEPGTETPRQLKRQPSANRRPWVEPNKIRSVLEDSDPYKGKESGLTERKPLVRKPRSSVPRLGKQNRESPFYAKPAAPPQQRGPVDYDQDPGGIFKAKPYEEPLPPDPEQPYYQPRRPRTVSARRRPQPQYQQPQPRLTGGPRYRPAPSFTKPRSASRANGGIGPYRVGSARGRPVPPVDQDGRPIGAYYY